MWDFTGALAIAGFCYCEPLPLVGEHDNIDGFLLLLLAFVFGAWAICALGLGFEVVVLLFDCAGVAGVVGGVGGEDVIFDVGEFACEGFVDVAGLAEGFNLREEFRGLEVLQGRYEE